MYFQTEKRPEFREKYEGFTFGQLSQKIASEWKQLSPEEKKPYLDKHLEDKKRYEKELKIYNERTAPAKKSDSDSSLSSSEEESSDDKRKKKRKAPGAPKNKSNAYMFFQKDQREKIKKENPNISAVELAKKLGEIWRKMTVEGKEPYAKEAEKDKERYDRELQEYKKKLGE